MKHGELRKYRVYHHIDYSEYTEIVEATTALEAIIKVKDMYKQHKVTKAWLLSK